MRVMKSEASWFTKLWNAFRGAFLIVNNLRGERIGFYWFHFVYQNKFPSKFCDVMLWQTRLIYKIADPNNVSLYIDNFQFSSLVTAKYVEEYEAIATCLKCSSWRMFLLMIMEVVLFFHIRKLSKLQDELLSIVTVTGKGNDLTPETPH